MHRGFVVNAALHISLDKFQTEGLMNQHPQGKSRILRTFHPDIKPSVHNLATCLMAQRDYAEAATFLYKVIVSCTTSAQADDAEFITILFNLDTTDKVKEHIILHNSTASKRSSYQIATYNAEGHLGKSQEAFEQVIAAKSREWGRDSPRMLISLSNLAAVLVNWVELEASEDEVLGAWLQTTDNERQPTCDEVL